MRRAFFFIVAVAFATTSFASIPRVSILDDAPAIETPSAETRVWASEVLAPFERPAEGELTRALRQGYEQAGTTNASGLGRFLSVDPTWESADLSKPQSWNRYSYVMNNPVNMVDPDGKWGIIFDLLDGGTPLFEKGYDKQVSDNPPRSQAEFDERVAAGAAVRTFQTYTKTNPETGDVYTGRTSGTGTPEQNIARRDAGHHKNAEGYGPAQLDKSSTNKDAIRGREQQVIEANGGARSRGGTSGNAINGIADKNPNKGRYLKEAAKEFGQILKKIFM